MRTLNDQAWDRRTSSWVIMQEKSRRVKEEADKLDKHGEERRRYIAERCQIKFR